MNKHRLDRLFRMKLRPVHNYREFWICSGCGNPRRLGIYHFARPCGKCKSANPALLVIQKKRRPWDKESLSRSRKSRVLLDAAKKSLSEIGIPEKLTSVIEDIRPNRPTKPRYSGWFTQVMLGSRILQGNLDFDVCLTSAPEQVRRYMAKTKMMQVRIPEDLHKWFKKYAHEYETTMTNVLITYLERLKARSTKKYEADQI